MSQKTIDFSDNTSEGLSEKRIQISGNNEPHKGYKIYSLCAERTA
jgi:hypothetical protein